VSMVPEPLLAVHDFHVFYGPAHILHGVTLEVDAEPLALLGRPEWSFGRKFGMLSLRGYLVVAVALLVYKAIQLGGG